MVWRWLMKRREEEEEQQELYLSEMKNQPSDP